MDIGHRLNRINRVRLKNLEESKRLQSLGPQHKIFTKICRNKAFLSESLDQSKFFKDELDSSVANQQTIQRSILKKQIGSIQKTSEGDERKLQKDRSAKSLQANLKSGSPDHSDNDIFSLSKLKDSSGLSPPSKKREHSRLTKVTTQNQISGTQVGSLSSLPILQKYDDKQRSRQKRTFDKNHLYLKKLKLLETESDDENKVLNNYSKSLNLAPSVSNSISVQRLSSSSKYSKIEERESQLLALLENRLSDQDYSDYNKKLFEKKEMNKKKFFTRYHSILKKQRETVSKSQSSTAQIQREG